MLSRIEDFKNSGIQVKVYIDPIKSALKVDFNKDFFVHIEVIRSIEYFMQEAAQDKKMKGEVLVNKTAIWLNQFLSKAFGNGLASTTYKPDYIKIARSY